MKTLLILRHAKSSWAVDGMPDHERPLNDRGKRDAPRMGQLLKEVELVPDAVYCSTAKRARKTATKVAKHCGFVGEIDFRESLYLAEPDAYIDVLCSQSDDVERAMVVGHNPGLEELVEVLTGQDEILPTAALVHLNLPIGRWQELEKTTSGELVNVWCPRELS